MGDAMETAIGEVKQRVRMNFGVNAKGLVQMDVTVEFPTVEEAEIEGKKAILAYKRICEERGLRLVEPTEGRASA
jgi:hypothetical protein